MNKRQAEKDAKARSERKERNWSRMRDNLSGKAKKVQIPLSSNSDGSSSPNTRSPMPVKPVLGGKFRSNAVVKNLAARSRSKKDILETVNEENQITEKDDDWQTSE